MLAVSLAAAMCGGSVLSAASARSEHPVQAEVRSAQRDATATEDQVLRAIQVDRLLTMNGRRDVFSPGMVLTRGGSLEYVGPPLKLLPSGYTLEHRSGWALPGMVDLHSHIVTDGWGGINDMVLPVNPQLSVAPTIKPSNRQIRLTCSAGVTTLFMIPGSGTSMGGFGVLYKTKTEAGYEGAVLADPGGLKVAQTHNPERGAGDVGNTRSGLYWTLQQINQQALAFAAGHRDDPGLADLAKVLTERLPVLIHCAGTDGVTSTVRMWRETYDTQSVLSHGSFDGWMAAEYVARAGMPVNHGPRTFDWFSSRLGRIVSSSAEYARAGVPNFSLNTDAPVVPAWELFLQGTVSTRYGGDSYEMLEALTINPARAFGIDGRVGSLEVGKDADLVVFDGDPLDPRSRVELVWIDGEPQYDRLADGQWF